MEEELYQVYIPDDLSEKRYISGMAALNLPAPEGTSGDWHFLNLFYRKRREDVEEVFFIAGENGVVDTNPIFDKYGIYPCEEALQKRGLRSGGRAYAANHFRAILDMLYEKLRRGGYPRYLQGATKDFLDTDEEKSILLREAEKMSPFLSMRQEKELQEWIRKESQPGDRA
jgi:hypothetical protein